MTPATTDRRPAVRLCFADGEVTAAPRDLDRFFLSGERAAQASRDAVRQDERVSRFASRLLVPLHDWCVARKDKVRACYLDQPNGTLKAYVVARSERFDTDLADEVADLDMALNRAGWRVNVWQIPDTGPETTSPFFRVEEAIEVYA